MEQQSGDPADRRIVTLILKLIGRLLHVMIAHRCMHMCVQQQMTVLRMVMWNNAVSKYYQPAYK